MRETFRVRKPAQAGGGLSTGESPALPAPLASVPALCAIERQLRSQLAAEPWSVRSRSMAIGLACPTHGSARSPPHPTPREVPEHQDPSRGGSRLSPRVGPAKGRLPMDVPRTSNRYRCYGSRDLASAPECGGSLGRVPGRYTLEWQDPSELLARDRKGSSMLRRRTRETPGAYGGHL